MVNDIVKSVSVANLVNQRAAVLQRLRQALDLLQEAEDLAAQAGTGFPTIGLCHSYSSTIYCRLSGRHKGVRQEAEEIIRKAVDAGAWEFLMAESGLRSFLDATAREEWSKAIVKGEVPELTADSVCGTFGSLYEQRGELFERGVIEVFRSLSWSYRANSPVRFGKRMVVRSLSNACGRGHCSIDHRQSDQLDDLVRVLHVLDGKPEPDHRDGMYHVLSRNVPEHAGAEFPRVAATDYLAVRLFRNGNGHVTFKRPDLVERMNLILAKHYPGALPEPR